ncbi:hypothetical protein [Faecalicoccus pleomorphus]|uniref:defense against restriction DarA-related protein n=1 Tax=Faecalicoccus pleomorphus TaxID=1323 RepID=UPI002943124C|nr:hypothetical protein [Faecalicoccus pleomorphus]
MSYKYFSTQRPLEPGAFPNKEDLSRVVNFEKPTQCVAVGKEVYGFAEYQNPLTEKECKDFELIEDYRSLQRLDRSFVRNMLSVPAQSRKEKDDETIAREIDFYMDKLCRLGESLQRIDAPYYLLVRTDFQKNGQVKTGYAVIGHDNPYDLTEAVLNDDFMATKNGVDLAYDLHKNCFTSIGYGSMGVQSIGDEKFPYVNTIQNDVYVLESGLMKPYAEKLVSRITAENGYAEVPEEIFNRLKVEASDLHTPVAWMVREMKDTIHKENGIEEKSL